MRRLSAEDTVLLQAMLGVATVMLYIRLHCRPVREHCVLVVLQLAVGPCSVTALTVYNPAPLDAFHITWAVLTL